MVFKAIVDTKQLANMSTMIFIKSQLLCLVTDMTLQPSPLSIFQFTQKKRKQNCACKNLQTYFVPFNVCNKYNKYSNNPHIMET